MAGETLNAYFAEWRAGSEWLMVELFRFLNDKEITGRDVLLESFSVYHCGNWGIYVEGLEFIVIPSLQHKENEKHNDDQMNEHGDLKPEEYNEWDKQIATDCREIISRSENNIQNASNGKIFSLSEVNRKKCHMIPAKSAICDSSNTNSYKLKPQAQSRFEDLVEILSYHEFQIKCDIETRMLSSNTSYACFLVFKLSEKSSHGLDYPVKVRDLLTYSKERTKVISFTKPSKVNLNKMESIPKEREDGWMEVIVWETISDDRQNYESIPMNLKLICFEGTMSGLIICGIEFRPV